jgi:SAM-dependent methyltransferase
MSDANWGDGYFVGNSYTAGFYTDLAPVRLNHVCLLNGIEPIDLDQPFSYLELGCGQGLTTTVLAANHPCGTFYGNDFMPSHILAARKLASSAKINNVTFLENSFSDLADGQVDLPLFDFITMHGVYSWVSLENRRNIVRIISRYLKPGGVVYVSYNALPGWAPVLPMTRLMRLASNSSSNGTDRFESAKKLVTDLAENQAAYFSVNSRLKINLDSLKNNNSTYLMHEYLNENSCPMYHAEVVEEMAAAKLEFVAPADLSYSCFDFLTPEQKIIINSIKDPAWSRTIKDFIDHVNFRKDIFVRGRRPIRKGEMDSWMERCVLTLTVRREQAFFPNLEANPLAIEVLDALAERSLTLLEFSKFPLCNGKIDLANQFLSLIVDKGDCTISVRSNSAVDAAPAHRLNRAIAKDSSFEDTYKVLASPMIGLGLPTTLVGRLVYGYITENPEEKNVQVIATHVQKILNNQISWMTEDKIPEALKIEYSALVERVELLLTKTVPFWKKIKII